MKIVLDFDSVNKNRIVELVEWLKKSGFIKRFQIENEDKQETPISNKKNELSENELSDLLDERMKSVEAGNFYTEEEFKNKMDTSDRMNDIEMELLQRIDNIDAGKAKLLSSEEFKRNYL
jgi:ribosomal protein S8